MVRVWVAGKTCDPLVTHGPYLSALEIKGLYIKHYINLSVYFTLLMLANGNHMHQSLGCKDSCANTNVLTYLQGIMQILV